jgi:uncharacterized protein YdcH (DUF465 family)
VINVEVLPRVYSDHNPLLVSFSNHRDNVWPSRRQFRYEASWEKNQEFGALVKQVWRVRKPWEAVSSNVRNNLKGCQRIMQRWVRKEGGKLEDQIQAKEQELQALQLQPLIEEEQELQLKDDIHSLLEQEEMKWKQRAKENWLQFGDRNTKFFHASANQKFKSHRMEKILDQEGQLFTEHSKIEGAFINYFTELFKAGSDLEVEASSNAIQPKVIAAMNNQLLVDFTPDEIGIALSQMAALKAPEPDGFTASFFQKNWSTIHGEVCNAIMSFFDTGVLDPNINMTNIVLIPKISSPQSVTYFRPISLCNVIYKLISKVLANRFKGVLSGIISSSQSAFLAGWLITDNVIIAYEILHTMQNRLWSKVGFMGLKLDMSKAYDRVEWAFLETVMRRLGFDDRWIHLVMACVKSVTYSVVVNGNSVGSTTPTRGISQGDPISPYLFLLCAEALSSLISHAAETGVITGVPTSPRGPRVSHLFFADDSLLFCRANSVEWRRLMKILGIYEVGSGQKLNLQKTSIIFSRNTSVEKKAEILNLSGFTEA